MKYIIMLLILFLSLQIWHPFPYNTEAVCFNNQSEIVFYASGYQPGSETKPLIELAKGTYRIRETGEKLTAYCKFYWGVDKPKGKSYWQGKEKVDD